jgi:SAM-dependent methyltransferase
VGPESVVAVDPSPPFVEAARSRFPGVRIEEASAESLPFEDEGFDVALAQLVVHFMADAVAGLAEMRRVTRPGGVVAACVWDFAGGQAPLSTFWRAAREMDPSAIDESALPGAHEGQLSQLLGSAGLTDITETGLVIHVAHESFDEWWEPYTFGVGPAGAFVASLDPERQAELRDRCRSLLPDAPFRLSGRAWAARGTA